MEALDKAFKERLSEIDNYLELLSTIEVQIQKGVPHFGANGPSITTTQRRILYSSVYLQLYNLIEATINKCIESICEAISKEKRWLPANLSNELRSEWVRYIAKTHLDLNYERRLECSMNLCDFLIKTLPICDLSISKGGGGNWDDIEIYKLAKRLGCEFSISEASNTAVKRHLKNEKGALALIVQLRNDLAHGSLSFAECGEGVTVTELKDLKSHTANYLEEVVRCFQSFIENHHFLMPDHRPTSMQA